MKSVSEKLPHENGWSYRFIWITHVICVAFGVIAGLATANGGWPVLLILAFWLAITGISFWPDNRTGEGW